MQEILAEHGANENGEVCDKTCKNASLGQARFGTFDLCCIPSTSAVTASRTAVRVRCVMLCPWGPTLQR